MRAPVLGLCLLAAMTAAPAIAQVLEFEQLDGWHDDTHAEALVAFLRTCDLIDAPDWRPICAVAEATAQDDLSARSFFELFFKPVMIGAPPALFTGYFEPELDGSPVRTPRYAYPIYRRPPELANGVAYHTRASIDGGAIAGRGLELAWLDDPIDVYFLQIQGSGRIRMTDGNVIRVGYAGANGQPYRSIGQEMVRRGSHRMDQVSAQEIRVWVRRNPAAGRELMHTNPSYVFFRKIGDLAADQGPIGAMGRSITTLRSVAIDPAFTPLGAPIWIEKDGREPLRRLMMAQDTGGAIKGMQRADIFYGTGAKAGDAAGTVKDPGRMILLLPIDRAYALLPEG
ncbi:MAG: murein transglycosylase A [Tabrizicola sp.]|uniref:murein transglycosylase A n=1 Tax=Tabrizicola sp. TaxID=2005166 RepID=UPI002735FE1E|nr:murein transglycosylase A [Tabrizicola sp.]MDP3261634.1 murein transglycosylase A [Tabrizicola sp.]MDP3648296.1 murein transglycosylase A [Paracoccaceae bacterium]MDZ4065593.1 murein transglycosylase A [Tabrizicola sp.]